MGSALTPIGLFNFNFIIHNNNKVKLKIFTFRIFKKTIITIVMFLLYQISCSTALSNTKIQYKIKFVCRLFLFKKV